MDLQLKDKVAIVTGGSRGIGKGVARVLAKEGVDVAILARDLSVAEACCSEIADETGRKIRPYRADTGIDGEVAAAVEAVANDYGRIDILVNNAAQPAGQSAPPRLNEITEAYFWSDVNVKVMGYIRMAREVAPHMIKANWGRIINISGLAARQTSSIVGSVRNVSVAAMSKNLADELSIHGINVNCIHPGLTRTEKTPEVIQRFAKAQSAPAEEIERRMMTGNLIQRFVLSEDIGNIVAFLASPLSIAINGESIGTGGGAPGAIHY